jgi:hypothetical protein
MRIVKKSAFVFYVIFLSAFLFGGVAFSVKAQTDIGLLTNPGAIRDNDIDVELIPAVPGPNQNVKIELASYATTMNKATITWTLNGKQALTGIGKTSFSFTTGDIGSTTTVDIAIIVEQGTRVDKKITVQPSQVDLLWEANESYVPLFYKGKALPIQESRIRVVAFPVERDGSIQPLSKVYNWKKNYVVDQASSGYGKYFFVLKNSYIETSNNISVATSSQSGSGSIGSLTLNYIKPQILLYENNPALGLRLNKLLNSGLTMTSGEMTISAEPFYFSKYNSGITDRNMQYKWTINGTTIYPPAQPNEITIKGSSQPGTASISIGITNINTLFQEAKQTISVKLGK